MDDRPVKCNLFAPAGITFAIWGVIYLLLGLHVLYRGVFSTNPRVATVLCSTSPAPMKVSCVTCAAAFDNAEGAGHTTHFHWCRTS